MQPKPASPGSNVSEIGGSGNEESMSGRLEAGYVAPPTEPPVLMVEGEPASPSILIWKSGSEIVRRIPGSDEDVGKNPVSLTNGFPLELNTDKPLGRTRLIYYEPMVGSGPPRIEDAHTIECGLDVERHFTRKKIGYEVQITRDLQPGGVLVMQVDYPTFEDSDRRAGVDVYSISWVLEIRS